MEGVQQQDRREIKPHQETQPPPPQQPQKCPRCESLNTKFCYYNNYSLSQPRYFCKTCRRYWTQGGTLRNVPVGGGCRKGKRSKKPSSSSSSDNLLNNNPSNLPTITTTTQTHLRNKGIDQNISSSTIPTSVSPIYYPSGGFLSSLAAIQSFNQPINVGGDFVGGSNMALLQGFNLPSFNPQLHHQQQQRLQLHQPQVFNMGSSDHTLEDNIIQPNSASTSHQEWPHQSFNNNNSNHPISSEAGYWSNNNNTSGTSGSSLNPLHWNDLSGFGSSPPPPSSSSSPSFL